MICTYIALFYLTGTTLLLIQPYTHTQLCRWCECMWPDPLRATWGSVSCTSTLQHSTYEGRSWESNHQLPQLMDNHSTSCSKANQVDTIQVVHGNGKEQKEKQKQSTVRQLRWSWRGSEDAGVQVGNDRLSTEWVYWVLVCVFGSLF